MFQSSVSLSLNLLQICLFSLLTMSFSLFFYLSIVCLFPCLSLSNFDIQDVEHFIYISTPVITTRAPTHAVWALTI